MTSEQSRWVANIPSTWHSYPGKALFAERRSPSRSSDIHLTPSQMYGVLPQAEYMARTGSKVVLNLEGADKMKHVEKDDFIIHLRSFQGGIERSTYEGKVSMAYTVLRPIGPNVPDYFRWVLKSNAFIEVLSTTTEQLRDGQSIKFGQFASLALPCPPPAVQRAIADYLDAETARIDALIEKKSQMSSLLGERLTRLSSEAVSEGPQVRVRHLTSLITSGPRGWADYVSEDGTPFIRSANLRPRSIEISMDNLAFVQVPDTAESRRSSVRVGDVIIGITGANVGWLAIVTEDLAGSFVSQHVAILRPCGVEPEWLANALAADQAQDQLLGGQYGGTKQQLGLQDLAELRISVPTLQVQRAAVDRLRAERQSHVVLLRKLQDQIRLLQEHRQALVTAAVTGEIDLTGVAA